MDNQCEIFWPGPAFLRPKAVPHTSGVTKLDHRRWPTPGPALCINFFYITFFLLYSNNLDRIRSEREFCSAQV